MSIDNRTPNLNLPLPNVNNLMKSEDVPRLRDAITLLDQAVSDRVTTTQLNAAIASILGGVPPDALNTLDELAAALNDNANFGSFVTTQLASKLSSVPIATSVALGGVKIGSGLTVAADGTISTTGAGSGTGLPSFSETAITPSSNGQTSFTIAGGYVPGQIELYVDGILWYGNGDDYTASNGTNIILVEGVNTTQKLLLRKWFYLPVETTVNKTGDTMTGPLLVPANATGNQVPRVSEVIRKSGDTMTGALTLVGDPNNPLESAPKQYVDTKLSKAGGTLTGALTLAADPVNPMEAATMQFVLNNGGVNLSAIHAAMLSF